jgi:imidazolonepropionase
MITLVKNIRQLVTPRGVEPSSAVQSAELLVREGVSLVVRDDRIFSVDSTVAVHADRVVDAGGGIVAPGLVDPCVSLRVYDNGASSESTGPSRLRVAMECLVRHGTTSAEVRAVPAGDSANVEDALAELQQLTRRVSLRLSTAFLGAPRPAAKDDRADRISSVIGETIPSVSRRRLASACVALCGDGGYSRKEARAVLRAARGAGFELRVQACGADTEAALVAAELGAGAIDHLGGTSLGVRPMALLKKAGTIPVLLPTLPLTDGGRAASARPFIDAGLAVALGSAADLAAGGVFSLWTAVALAVRSLDLSIDEALVAATLNSASAMGIAASAGTLEPGKSADFAIIEIEDYRRIPDFVVGLPIRAVFVAGKEVSHE